MIVDLIEIGNEYLAPSPLMGWRDTGDGTQSITAPDVSKTSIYNDDSLLKSNIRLASL
jgi:hypothetical protein